MRSPVSLHHVTTLDEPSEWAVDPICEPAYRALGEVILGFDDALAAAILPSERYEAKVAILAAPGPHDLTGRLLPIASIIPTA
jgi:hypothetical protein